MGKWTLERIIGWAVVSVILIGIAAALFFYGVLHIDDRNDFDKNGIPVTSKIEYN